MHRFIVLVVGCLVVTWLGGGFICAIVFVVQAFVAFSVEHTITACHKVLRSLTRIVPMAILSSFC